MIWLISFGISKNHGSELLVGWQWLQRLDILGQVTPIVSKVFDNEDFLDQSDRKRIIFIDTSPENLDEVNRKHAKHVYRFWKGARAHLKLHATSDDIIVIVSPAATWFMPWISGLSVPRNRIFYGPVGPVRLQARLSPRDPKPFLRDLAIVGISLFWRILARAMPRHVSLRYPSSWFRNLIGHHYDISHLLPEVEVEIQKATEQNTEQEPTCLMILFDLRYRKNFRENLEYALERAKATKQEIVLIGATREEVFLAHPNNIPDMGIINFRPKIARKDFLQWLNQERPEIVNLSLSEGVPSMLLEALMAGCRLHIYEVGGLVWLIQYSARHILHTGASRIVHEIAWNNESFERYRSDTAQRFASLTASIRTTMESSS